MAAPGQIDFMVDSISAAVPFVQNRQMRVLAATTAKRDSAMPEAPTLAESGLDGFDVLGWLGLVGPPGMPAAVRDKINVDLKKVMAQDSTSAQQTFSQVASQYITRHARSWKNAKHHVEDLCRSDRRRGWRA